MPAGFFGVAAWTSVAADHVDRSPTKVVRDLSKQTQEARVGLFAVPRAARPEQSLHRAEGGLWDSAAPVDQPDAQLLAGREPMQVSRAGLSRSAPALFGALDCNGGLVTGQDQALSDTQRSSYTDAVCVRKLGRRNLMRPGDARERLAA